MRRYHAYNDKDDVTHAFTMNGLRHANKVLQHEAFKLSDWEAIGEYLYDREGSRHRAFVVPKTNVTVEGKEIKQGEKVRIEESYKWPRETAEAALRRAKTAVLQTLSNEEGSYGM